MSSNHTIYYRKPKITSFGDKEFFCSELFYIRIGSKEMYKDLRKKGLHPRKSLTMKFPFVPAEYLKYFIRGYFDGDGCLYVKKTENRKCIIQIIFTSGSFEFLKTLSENLSLYSKTSTGCIYENCRSYKLSYKKRDRIAILNFIYNKLENAPYLERKFNIFKRIQS